MSRPPEQDTPDVPSQHQRIPLYGFLRAVLAAERVIDQRRAARLASAPTEADQDGSDRRHATDKKAPDHC